jgi:hypothetical protein
LRGEPQLSFIRLPDHSGIPSSKCIDATQAQSTDRSVSIARPHQYTSGFGSRKFVGLSSVLTLQLGGRGVFGGEIVNASRTT